MKTKTFSRICLIWIVAVFLTSLFPIASSPATDEYYIFFSSWDGSSWSDPAEVIEIYNANSTQYSFQRKVWKTNDNYYWVTFFDRSDRTQYHIASADGTTWIINYTGDMWDNVTYGQYPYSPLDVNYPCLTTLVGVKYEGAYMRSGSGGSSVAWKPFNTTGTDITVYAGGASGGNTQAFGASVTSCLDGTDDFYVWFNNASAAAKHRLWDSAAVDRDDDATLEYGNGSSLGSKILNYKTSSPYDMISIHKANDAKLYWGYINRTTRQWNQSLSANEVGATLSQGYNDWSATTEATAVSAPELIHLVYVDSSGDMYYRSFSSDAWSAATDLGISGADYVTTAVDDSGNILVTYVRANRIRYLYNDGSWSSERTLGNPSEFTNPAYLSSNQNEQGGELLLVWTANGFEAPPSNTHTWVRVATPHAFAAITVFSLSLTVGIGVSFLISLEGQNMEAMVPVVVVGIGVTIALFIALPLLNAFLGL